MSYKPSPSVGTRQTDGFSVVASLDILVLNFISILHGAPLNVDAMLFIKDFFFI